MYTECLCGRLGCGAVCIYGKLAGVRATIVRCLPPLGYGYNPPGKVNPSPRYTSALPGRSLGGYNFLTRSGWLQVNASYLSRLREG